MKTIEDFKRKKTKRSLGIEIDQVAIQTGNPHKTYKRGDKHPLVKGLVFRQWQQCRPIAKEVWVTTESLERELELRRKREKSKAFKKLKRIQDREYYLRNKNSVLASVNKWKDNNKNKTVIYGRTAASKRRARIKKASTKLTFTEEQLIKQYYNYSVRLKNKLGIEFHVDHIVPLSIGGLHHPSNLQVVPARWNKRKHNRNTKLWLPNGL